MPEGFNSIEDLKVALTAHTAPLEQGLSSARQHIATFSEMSGRDLKKFDTGLEAIGSRIEMVKGKIGVWLALAEKTLAIVNEMTSKGDKWAGTLGAKDEWDEVKTGVTDLTSSIGEGLTAAYDAAIAKMKDFSGTAQDTNSAWNLFGDQHKSAAKTIKESLVEVLKEAQHNIQRLHQDMQEWSVEKLERESGRLSKQMEDLRKLVDAAPSSDVPFLDRLFGRDALAMAEKYRKELAEIEAQAERIGMIAASKWATMEKVDPWPAAEVTDSAEKFIKQLEQQVRGMQQRAAAARMESGAAAAYLAEMQIRNQMDDQGLALTAASTRAIRDKTGAIAVITRAEAERKKLEQDEKNLERIFESLQRQTEQLHRQATAYTTTAGAAARLAAEEKALGDAKSKGIALTAEQLGRIADYGIEIERTTNRLEDMKRMFALIKESGDLVTRSLTSAFDKFMDGTEIKGREMVGALLREFARLTFIRTVLQPAQAGAQSLLGNLVSGVTAAPGNDWATSVIPAFAEGGYAEAGKPALVGENGPEIIVPSSGGTVVPNDQLRAALDGMARERRPDAAPPPAVFDDLQRAAITQAILTRAETEIIGRLREEWLERPSLPAFAEGGYAQAGKPAIIGERGPELFLPQASGAVVPTVQVREALGEIRQSPAPVTVNIDARGSTPDAVAMLERRIPSIIIQTVADARERGMDI